MTKSGDSLPFAPAAARNQAPIAAVLLPRLAGAERVLEIGAGTGQHAVAFSAASPETRWLATERSDALPGLAARIEAEGGAGLEAPRALDVCTGPWPVGPFSAVYTANTLHIMPWDEVLAMVTGVAAVLREGGVFAVYGPFQRGGQHTSDSNARFHEMLRRGDPAQGVRDLDALESHAGEHHLMREALHALPANNLLVLFRKEGERP